MRRRGGSPRRPAIPPRAPPRNRPILASRRSPRPPGSRPHGLRSDPGNRPPSAAYPPCHRRLLSVRRRPRSQHRPSGGVPAGAAALGPEFAGRTAGSRSPRRPGRRRPEPLHRNRTRADELPRATLSHGSAQTHWTISFTTTLQNIPRIANFLKKKNWLSEGADPIMVRPDFSPCGPPRRFEASSLNRSGLESDCGLVEAWNDARRTVVNVESTLEDLKEDCLVRLSLGRTRG